ncbi:MAG: hypothetical protein ABGX16_11250, partial [Pirellulales bacterium]
FSGRETSARSFNAQHDSTAFGFSTIYARAIRGEGDKSELHGSNGNDQFVGKPNESRLKNEIYTHTVFDFDTVVGRSGLAGDDRAELFDSLGNDRLVAWPAFMRLEGEQFSIEAKHFDEVHARALDGGEDTAWLHDSSNTDAFSSTSGQSEISNSNFRNIASGFERVISRSAHGGADRASFEGSPENDTFVWDDTVTRHFGNQFDNRAIGYITVDLQADQGGQDQGWFYPSDQGFQYSGQGKGGHITGPGSLIQHVGLEQVHVAWPQGQFSQPSLDSIEYDFEGVEQQGSDFIPLGSGIVHPLKLLPDPSDPSRVLAITGQGESGGNSWFYALNISSLEPVAEPLRVGSNASDFAWIGNNLIAVTARGSNELYLVDVSTWQIIDHLEVMEEPIAVTSVSNNQMIIASIRKKQLQVIGLDGGALVLKRTIEMPGTAYTLKFDSSRERIYVNHPSLQTISEIDFVSGNLLAQYLVGGEPSYAGILVDNYYVATNRLGTLNFINRSTGEEHTLDLAIALGLDRAELPVRGIEPIDLIVLDPLHFVVINNRQDSLLFTFNPFSTEFEPPQVAARFAGAAHGMHLPQSGDLLMTVPSINRIDRAIITTQETGFHVSVQQNIVGVAPRTAVRIGSGPEATIAVVTTDHKLHLINEFRREMETFSVLNGYKVSAWRPMAADDNGILWLIVNDGTERRLLGLSIDGTVVFDFASNLQSPFSIQAGEGFVIVIDRVNQQVQQYDLVSATAEVITLAQQRPRHADILTHDQRILIHDTNPDIGVTIDENGQFSFHPHTAGRWLTSLDHDENERVFLLDYNGSVFQFDLDNQSIQHWTDLPHDRTMEMKYHDFQIWVVSPSFGSVVIVNSSDATLQTLWSGLDSYDVLPSEGGAWLVSSSGLKWKANTSDTSWWK